MHLRMKFLLTAYLFCAPARIFAHSGAELPIILDTDMALDDIRAIVLLSQYDGVNLLAGVTSDGGCGPESGAANLRRVLTRLGLEHVPVAVGRELEGEPPLWRPMAESLHWPVISEDIENRTATSSLSALDLLSATIAQRDKVVYLCLGPLSNLADLLASNPSAVERIAAVHYYGSSPDDPNPSWNTARDPGAAKSVFASCPRVRPLQLDDDQLLTYDAALSAAVCALGGTAAELLCTIHASERMKKKVDAGHFRCWDEAVVLDLLFPELFAERSEFGEAGLTFNFDLKMGRQQYLDLLAGDLSMKHGHRQSITLRAFPTELEQLRADVAGIARGTLSRHGSEEWNTVLLTNELHRHLGIYSILGAKMGIRARELLDAGLDELRVVSYAGTEPPLSCLTDGLQVATGATLGRGTISVHPEENRPGATFRFGEKVVALRIKDEIVARIRADIQTCIEEHGALTPVYWEAVRALALVYWLELDRTNIFEESWLEESN